MSLGRPGALPNDASDDWRRPSTRRRAARSDAGDARWSVLKENRDNHSVVFTGQEAREIIVTAQVLGRIDEILGAMAKESIDGRRFQEQWGWWWIALYTSAPSTIFDQHDDSPITKEVLKEIENLAGFLDQHLWRRDARGEIS